MPAEMEASVDKKICVACGMCVASCPAAFRFGADGLAEGTGAIPRESLEDAEDAMQDCPVGAIELQG